MSTSSYIIKYINNSANIEEGLLYIYDSTIESDPPTLNIKNNNGDIKLNIANILNTQFEWGYDESNKISKHNVKIYNYVVYIDSESAYDNLKDLISTIKNSNYTSYYPSGNIEYCGSIIMDENNVPHNHGKGIQYYDVVNSLKTRKIKYQGEFDHDNYDGSGEFRSKECDISVRAINISNGIPQDKVKLCFNDMTKEINMVDVWLRFNLKDKNEKRLFVMGDTFVDKLFIEYHLNGNQLEYEEFIFNSKPADAKIALMKSEIEKLKTTIIKLNKEQHSIRDEYNKSVLMVALYASLVIICRIFF